MIWPGGRCSAAGMSSWPSPRTCTARTRSCLEALVDRALADPEVIPLVGVAGAREQAHSLASVLARETAIADEPGPPGRPRRRPRHSQRARRWRPSARSRPDLGGRLSAEQASAAMAICTSGRGAEIVVGVAGAGKTTMLPGRSRPPSKPPATR